MIKRSIFTYCNFQIEREIADLQKQVIDQFNTVPNCKYEYLFYNRPDGEIVPNQVINYGLNKLFYEDNYDTILMLDIDCIPLNTRALEYSFLRAEQGVLIGNVQRSNHIENNRHIYPAPSCITITKNMFERLGRPSFDVTYRGDIGEELCYLAEEKGIEIEMFMPQSFEELAQGYNKREAWNLRDDQPKYGIGTTFVDKDGNEMFYHLFQCRLNIFNHRFKNKCKHILKG